MSWRGSGGRRRRRRRRRRRKNLLQLFLESFWVCAQRGDGQIFYSVGGKAKGKIRKEEGGGGGGIDVNRLLIVPSDRSKKQREKRRFGGRSQCLPDDEEEVALIASRRGNEGCVESTSTPPPRSCSNLLLHLLLFRDRLGMLFLCHQSRSLYLILTSSSFQIQRTDESSSPVSTGLINISAVTHRQLQPVRTPTLSPHFWMYEYVSFHFSSASRSFDFPYS